MKLKGLSLLAVLNVCLFATTAQANIIAHIPTTGKENICDNLAGEWEGNGTVTAKVVFEFTCEYHGKGTVTSSPSGDLTLNMTLDKRSGICPSGTSLSLPGHCDSQTGVVILKTDSAELIATLTNQGRSADVVGLVKFPVPIIGEVVAKIKEMHLDKK